MVKNTFLSAVVAVVVSLAVMFLAGNGQVVPQPFVPGGLDENSRVNFSAGINPSAIGGGVVTLASGSVTFTGQQICDNALIVQSGSTAAIASAQSNHFPSASSLISNCLPQRGDSRTVRFENNSVAGAGRFIYTFLLGSGMDIFVASGSAANDGKGDGPKLWPEAAAVVRFTNINGSSVSADFIEMINGD